MIFAREAGAALVLVTLTLSLQCTWIAALISCVRASLSPAVHRLGPIRSAMLMLRLMTAFIGLHVLEILLEARMSDAPVTDTGDASPGARIRLSISRLSNGNC
jgi:hypothetical protein